MLIHSSDSKTGERTETTLPFAVEATFVSSAIHFIYYCFSNPLTMGVLAATAENLDFTSDSFNKDVKSFC